MTNQPNNQNEYASDKDRRSKGRLFHRYQRQTDPSIWFPGVITLVVGAAILWAASALNDVEGLRLAQEHNEKWHEECELRTRMLEMAVSRLLPQKDMKGMYMATSGSE